MSAKILHPLSTTFSTFREVAKKDLANYVMFSQEWRGWHGDSIFLDTLSNYSKRVTYVLQGLVTMSRLLYMSV